MNSPQPTISDTIFYHSADYDGLLSGAVLLNWFTRPSVVSQGWDYGHARVPFPKQGFVYVADLSLDMFENPDEIDWDRLAWIDHHAASIEKWRAIAPCRINGYQMDGVAACRLAHAWLKGHMDYSVDDFIQRRVEEPLLLTLAGEYDVWDHRDPRAKELQFGLRMDGHRLRTLQGLLGLPEDMQEAAVSEMCSDGRKVMQWQEEFAREIAETRIYIRRWHGLRFAVLGSAHAVNSSWFAGAEADANLAWRYDGDKVSISLYHNERTDVDLSEIARKYGGGGHRGACGFTLPLDEALEIIR